MSILIKDIDMPDKCLNCIMLDYSDYHCRLYSLGIPERYNYETDKRPEWCELVEYKEKEN